MPLCLGTAVEFLGETKKILKEYALRPDATEPVYMDMRSRALAEALGTYTIGDVKHIQDNLPASLMAARQKWHKAPVVA